MLVSISGVAALEGWDVAGGTLRTEPFDFAAHWSFSAIPMFLLMGAVAHHSGISASLFKAAKLWLGGLRVGENGRRRRCRQDSARRFVPLLARPASKRRTPPGGFEAAEGAVALRLDDAELARLIEGGESSRVEFKERLEGSAPEKIREAVCAFANDLAGTREPGIVVVGLTDDLTPVGVADETLLALTDIRSEGNIVPPPALLVEKRLWRDAEIAVATVLPSDSPPVRYKGAIHVRNGPRRGIATAQEERILNERRRFGDRPFDLSPVPGSGIPDLSRRRFEDEYLPNSVSSETLAANDRSLAQRLAAAKMIASADDETATILGLLVLGIRPRDFIPGAYIQFLRIEGATLADEIVDSAEYDGTISDMLQGIEEKLRAHNRRRVDLTSEDREVRTEDFPLAALQQLVRNAVMHRSYEATNAPVRVTWFDDRIEIQNSGGPSVTRENFGNPGGYRNPNLAEAMKALGFVQRFGVGIQTAQRLLRASGCPEAEFEVQPTHVLATVRALR